MQIAVITITRNNVEGLRRTITSVRCQTYADILHVIIDGDSTDGTAEVLDAERRNGTAMDVAKAIEYLAQADFVTGQILPVNGGYVI